MQICEQQKAGGTGDNSKLEKKFAANTEFQVLSNKLHFSFSAGLSRPLHTAGNAIRVPHSLQVLEQNRGGCEIWSKQWTTRAGQSNSRNLLYATVWRMLQEQVPLAVTKLSGDGKKALRITFALHLFLEVCNIFEAVAMESSEFSANFPIWSWLIQLCCRLSNLLEEKSITPPPKTLLTNPIANKTSLISPQYPRNVTCYWTIRQKVVPTCKHAMVAVSQENSHKSLVKRSIASLNKTSRTVRAWSDCTGERDHLIFYDGSSTNDPVLAKYCGGDWLPKVVSR